jgi:hypothetical protein
MEKHLFKGMLLAVFLAVLILFISGFTSLGPAKLNTPYSEKLTDNLNKLEQWNPIVAKEIRKLPEIQDGVSDFEAKAIDELVEIYSETGYSFDNAFEQMYQVGKPEVRKFCSPLQALFWLVVDKKVEITKETVADYSLEKLLNNAWNFSKKPIYLSEEQISVVIDNITDQSMKKLYLENKHDKDFLLRLITINYKSKRHIFNYKAKKIIKNAKELRDKGSQWADFNTVVERLNDPNLIDYYELRNFSYEFYISNFNGTHPEGIFKRSKGNCVAYTTFTIHCLKKAGYFATHEMVPGIVSTYHITTIYKDNGDWFIIDNSRKNVGHVGPFSSLQEAIKEIYY